MSDGYIKVIYILIIAFVNSERKIMIRIKEPAALLR
jgi:hypothetical protein